MRWWDHLFTRKGFRHCYAMTHDPVAKRWLVYDWRSNHVFFGYVDNYTAEACIAMVMQDGCALEAKETWEGPDVKFSLHWIYCVSSIKKLLGIANWRIITPYQLYRELLRRGCTPVFTGEGKA